MNVDQVSGVHWLVQAAVMEGAFANGSAFGGTPAQEIYRRWWEGNDMQTYANTYGHDIDMISEVFCHLPSICLRQTDCCQSDRMLQTK